jgi:hypothetical protein
LGIFAKASSVGAKTVKGPLPLSVDTRSAALGATTSVLKLPAVTAVSTMSLAYAARAVPASAAAMSSFSHSFLVLTFFKGVGLLGVSVSSRRQQHRVDDVDQPVGGRDVGLGDVDLTVELDTTRRADFEVGTI